MLHEWPLFRGPVTTPSRRDGGDAQHLVKQTRVQPTHLDQGRGRSALLRCERHQGPTPGYPSIGFVVWISRASMPSKSTGLEV